jgi:DNA-binding NtrC family response regulator
LLDQGGPGAGPGVRFSRAALELLAALPWTGNVPELEEVVRALSADVRRPIIQLEDVLRHVSLDGAPPVAAEHGLREAREQFERRCVEEALTRHQGRVGEAARALGMQRTNLYRKVRQLGISRTRLSGHR